MPAIRWVIGGMMMAAFVAGSPPATFGQTPQTQPAAQPTNEQLREVARNFLTTHADEIAAAGEKLRLQQVNDHWAAFGKTRKTPALESLTGEVTAEEGVKMFGPLLDDPDLSVQVAALYGLSLWGRRTGPLAPRIIQIYVEGSDQTQIAAAAALGGMEPAPHEAIAALVKGVSRAGATRELRIASMRALGKLGSAAREALPALEEARHVKDSQAAYEAFAAIEQIDHPEPLTAGELQAQGFVAFRGATPDGRRTGIYAGGHRVFGCGPGGGDRGYQAVADS